MDRAPIVVPLLVWLVGDPTLCTAVPASGSEKAADVVDV